MKNNRRLIRVSGALLSASFFITNLGLPVLAADNLMGTEKNETVYIITDASGKPDSVIVSDWLKNSGKLSSIADQSDLSDIEVVKGDTEYTGPGRICSGRQQGRTYITGAPPRKICL